MFNFITGNTPEKWEKIKAHSFYRKDLEALAVYGEQILSSPIPETRYTDYYRFLEDGDRKAYEKPYFERRDRLTALTILCRLYGEKYLPALCDLIWAICEMTTWALPAHIKEGVSDAQERREFLELGSTNIGALLSETVLVLGDMLPTVIRERVRDKVRERIINSYFKNLYWWFDGTNNWGAVCSHNVAVCLMVFGTEREFFRAEPTLHRTMEQFLASYGSDGCCQEGISYWDYGFGHFLMYADAVRNYTRQNSSVCVEHARLSVRGRRADCVDGGAGFVRDGVVDYFLRRDVKEAALYPFRMHLTGDRAVSFSDGSGAFSYTRAYFTLLHREYPDAVSLPDCRFATRSFKDLRYYLWADPDEKTENTFREGTSYYAEAQWFIRKTARYSLAAKGGHNHEPHNHNDVGSFLLTLSDGSMPLADLGAGLYTKQFFELATRYDHLVTSSRGHSVPIVNGAYQVYAEHRATLLSQTDDSFEMEISASYECPSLSSLIRRFDCDADGVTLVDRFVFTEASTSLVERFVLTVEPSLGDGEVRIGGARLVYDAARLSATVTAEDYLDHAGHTATAYLLDLTAKAPVSEAAYTFRILV